MSDSLVHVDIELLRRHPELPAASDILTRFAEHHAQSEARRRAHDQLMESDSNLDLEDFGALAASALGSNESHDSVLGEETSTVTDELPNDGDTLPELEAAPEDASLEEAPDDTQEDTNEESLDAEHQAQSNQPSDDTDGSDDENPESTEHDQLEAASDASEPAKESSPKKRTRKRKSKKKKKS